MSTAKLVFDIEIIISNDFDLEEEVAIKEGTGFYPYEPILFL